MPLPRWTVAVCALVVGVLIVLVALAAKAPTRAATAPEPQPTATYTTYVPQMPQECYVLVEKTDAAVLLGLKLDETTTKAMQLQRTGNLNGALAKFKEADKLADQVKKARDAYVKQAERCEDK